MVGHKTRKIIVVDDDRLLSGGGVEVLAANQGSEGLGLCAREKIDVVLLDQKLPDGDGHLLCPSILEYSDKTKILFITAYPSLENSLTALRAGAYDYLCKPFELEELKLAVERSLRATELEQVEEFQYYNSERESKEKVLVGDGLRDIRRLIEVASLTDVSVLITGETGTGKNVAAGAIHYGGRTPKFPFVSINCAALPENLIEAELFGFEQGAFTGASRRKRGLFEMADGGTILLDEIGEMPLHLQTKILSVLDDKKIKRVGGESSRAVEVRIIAASNADIETVLGRTFRRDLYYRLSVLRIHIPPLRERRSDIPQICDYLLEKLSGEDLHIPPEEMDSLMDYEWPGNVRELRNILERSFILRKGSALRPSAFLGKAKDIRPERLPSAPECGIAPLEEMERQHIKSGLTMFSGNYSRTARALGISLSTLKRKLKHYGLVDQNRLSESNRRNDFPGSGPS
jgi:DNA-binding NtrC family response regulator